MSKEKKLTPEEKQAVVLAASPEEIIASKWTSCPECSALSGDECVTTGNWDTQMHGSTKTGMHCERLLPISDEVTDERLLQTKEQAFMAGATSV